MRVVRKRFRLPTPQSPFRRHEDGREVCFANDLGRAEYQRRKQLLWADQQGICAHCSQRMALDDTRMTHGAWEGKLRDDRLVDGKGRKNELVHKGCLRAWHNVAGPDTGAER
jgi:hypothetical protein